MLDKDLAIASNIGKWLIIIALSYIAISFLFIVIVALFVAVYFAPKLRILKERLRKHPDMKNPSAKKKCFTFLKESIIVLFPEELNDVKFIKKAHNQIIETCDQASNATSMANLYDYVVNDCKSDCEYASPAYDAHKESAHAAAAAAKKNLTPQSQPNEHLATQYSNSENADGLGVHAL